MRCSCKAFSQLVIKGGRAQPILDGAIPGLEVLHSIRKQAEQARGSKPVRSTSPWLLHPLLSPSSCPVWVPVLTSFGDEQQCGSVSWINLLFPNLLLGHDVCAGAESLTKTWLLLCLTLHYLNLDFCPWSSWMHLLDWCWLCSWLTHLYCHKFSLFIVWWGLTPDPAMAGSWTCA